MPSDQWWSWPRMGVWCHQRPLKRQRKDCEPGGCAAGGGGDGHSSRYAARMTASSSGEGSGWMVT